MSSCSVREAVCTHVCFVSQVFGLAYPTPSSFLGGTDGQEVFGAQPPDPYHDTLDAVDAAIGEAEEKKDVSSTCPQVAPEVRFLCARAR